LVAAVVGEPTGVVCLGVEPDQDFWSKGFSIEIAGRGGARGRGRGHWKSGAVATTTYATTILVDAAADGVWAYGAIWLPSSLWFHARSYTFSMGFQLPFSLVLFKFTICSAIKSVGCSSTGWQPGITAAIPELYCSD
jgi:hypothetical protein